MAFFWTGYAYPERGQIFSMYNKYFCSCGGNPNNYLTEDECLTTCTEDAGSETTVRPQGEAKDPQEVRER